MTTRSILYVAAHDMKPDRDSHWVKAFGQAGFETHIFSISEHLRLAPGLLGKIERRAHVGKGVIKLRQELIEVADRIRPDWIHFRNPLMFDKATILAIKDRCSLMTSYCNDDPFSPYRVKWHWHLYLTTIPLFDAHFIYRERNVKDLIDHGARHVMHTAPVYVPWRHFPPTWNDGEYQQFRSDAAFVGHWENDNRLEAIDSLIRAGFHVVLKGGMWDKPCKGRPAEKLTPIMHAFGEDYNKIYASATAGLCFFSKINRDELTERTFEIPAVGGLLVCERTNEVQGIFKDREEAFFFSDTEELVDIVRLVSRDGNLRGSVAHAGRARLLQGRHTVTDRVEEMLEFLVHNGLLGRG